MQFLQVYLDQVRSGQVWLGFNKGKLLEDAVKVKIKADKIIGVMLR